MQKTAQLCSAVLVALRYIMVYFTEGILSTPFTHSQLLLNGITDSPPEKAWKAMAQGQAYKQTLLCQIDRVRELIANVDQEAAVSLQYRLRDLEKLSREYFPTITRQLLELREEQQKSQNFYLDEATRNDLSTRIGEAAAGYAINSFYSHLSSNPSIDGRPRGKVFKVSNHDPLLKYTKGAVPLQILEAHPSPEMDNPKACE